MSESAPSTATPQVSTPTSTSVITAVRRRIMKENCLHPQLLQCRAQVVLSSRFRSSNFLKAVGTTQEPGLYTTQKMKIDNKIMKVPSQAATKRMHHGTVTTQISWPSSYHEDGWAKSATGQAQVMLLVEALAQHHCRSPSLHKSFNFKATRSPQPTSGPLTARHRGQQAMGKCKFLLYSISRAMRTLSPAPQTGGALASLRTLTSRE